MVGPRSLTGAIARPAGDPPDGIDRDYGSSGAGVDLGRAWIGLRARAFVSWQIESTPHDSTVSGGAIIETACPAFVSGGDSALAAIRCAPPGKEIR